MASSIAYSQIVRISRRDSAWVYHVLEAQDGIVSYSTLPVSERFGAPFLSPDGEGTCDLELMIPAGFLTQVQEVLDHLRCSGVWIYEIQPALEE